MIAVYCERCTKELDSPGALLFGPPRSAASAVRKYHICADCWIKVLRFVCGVNPEGDL